MATSLYYFSKMPQVRNMNARLCSDVLYSYNNLSSCVLVGQVAQLCGTTPLFCNHDDFSKLLSNSVDRKVTNLVLATCTCHG